MTDKELTIDLPGIESPAVVVVARAGQVHPAYGDDVRVRWELHLPADGRKSNHLHDECCFAGRIDPVCGQYLTTHWGEGCFAFRPGYVARDGQVSARKWAEAFRQAEDYVLDQLEPLVKALEARKRALEEAEE